jgi:hypothetical protein
LTTRELTEILAANDGFKNDLRALSGYLASIKQGRPIIFALAKCLWKRGKGFQLEYKKRDLVVDKAHLEFKYSYDCDMEKVDDEMKRYGDKSGRAMFDAVRLGKLKKGWSQCAPIIEDMFLKKVDGRLADIFVWIIHSRDLSKLSDDARGRINWSKVQCNWNKTHRYSDRYNLEIADRFLAKLKPVRRFSIAKSEIESNGDFPSTYHFRICDFREATR